MRRALAAGIDTKWLLGALLVGGAALRLWFCLRLPVNTGDVLRHLYQGLAVWEHGPAIAAQPLTALDASLARVAWAGQPYNYPPVALAFFTVVAGVWPSIFFAKLALTVVEACNAWQIARLTHKRWFAAAYWCWPASIWWVSGEGQFEPLQALFVFAALRAIDDRPVRAAVLLALAVQVKLSAVLLVPVLVQRAWRGEAGVAARMAARMAAGFAVGLAPTAVASWFYPAVAQTLLYRPPMRYNPFFWNLGDSSIFAWNPAWLITYNQVVLYVVLALLVVHAVRARAWWETSGAVGFLLACKLVTRAQFWYLLLLPSFVAAVRSPMVRAIVFLTLPLLEVRSLVELLTGPFGYVVGDYYRGYSVLGYLRLPS